MSRRREEQVSRTIRLAEALYTPTLISESVRPTPNSDKVASDASKVRALNQRRNKRSTAMRRARSIRTLFAVSRYFRSDGLQTREFRRPFEVQIGCNATQMARVATQSPNPLAMRTNPAVGASPDRWLGTRIIHGDHAMTRQRYDTSTWPKVAAGPRSADTSRAPTKVRRYAL